MNAVALTVWPDLPTYMIIVDLLKLEPNQALHIRIGDFHCLAPSDTDHNRAVTGI